MNRSEIDSLLQRDDDTRAESARRQLLVGPYRSGKSKRLIEQLLDSCWQNPLASAIVLVPSHRYQTLFEGRLKNLIEEKQASPNEVRQSGLVGLQVLNFYRLCQKALRQLGVTFRVVPDSVRFAIIQRIMMRMKDAGELVAMAPSVTYAGSYQGIVNLIDEFERAALLPDDVLRRLEQTAQSEARDTELAKIYKNYWQELERLEFFDQRQLAFKLREVLSNTPPHSFKIGILVVDGFDRFNRLQLQVIAELSRFAEKTLVSFDYLDDRSDTTTDYLWKETIYKDMKKIFAERFAIVPCKPEPKRMPPVVSRFQATDRFLELEEIANRIKRKIVKEGTKPEQILVVARDLTAYKNAARYAFDQAGIPYFVDEAIAIDALPVVQFFITLITLAHEQFPRAKVVALLRNSFFNLEASALGQSDLENIDRQSMAYAVVQGSKQWSEIGSDKLNQLFVALTAAPSASKFAYVKWVEDLLDKFFLDQSQEADVDPQITWEQSSALGELHKNLAALLVQEIILGEENIAFDTFIERLLFLIRRSNFRPDGQPKSTVTICSAELTPNRSFEHIFVAGMVEGEFPRGANNSGSINPVQIEHWQSFGVEISNPRHHALFETAVFNALIDRARLSLTLSFPGAEMDGEELLPSFLLSQIQGDEIQLIQAYSSALHSPTSVRSLVAAELWWRKESAENVFERLTEFKEQAILPLIEQLAAPCAFGYTRIAERKSLLNGYLVEMVEGGALKIALPERWSATNLSDYGKCPFRFWVSHMLRYQRWQEPTEGLSALLRGSLYHSALEIFYRHLSEENLNLLNIESEAFERLFDKSVEEAFAELESQQKFRPGEFFQYEKLALRFRLEKFLQKEIVRAQKDKEGFVPWLFEAQFGSTRKGSSYPPLVLQDGEREIVIHGRIDRLDRVSSTDATSTKVRVIDYKSGTAFISKDDVSSGRNLQLPLYALAVERAIQPGCKVTQGQYLSITSGELIGGLDLSDQALDQTDEQNDNLSAKQRAETQVKGFVRRIAAGDFTVAPDDRSVCNWCDHQAICRIREIQSTNTGGNA